MKKSFMMLLLLAWMSHTAMAQPIDSKRITIARDAWGVPHIFAPTNREVAYGLAWANAEDAFKEVQELAMLARQYKGRNNGIEGAGFDFFVHAIDAERTYNEHIKELSPDFLAYLDGYVQGINAYAAAHTDEVLQKKLFPISTKDVLKAYVIAFSALGGAADQVENIMKGRYDAQAPYEPKGSNAYAFSSAKTIDGKTYLAINPHFMVHGNFSFYEAHLCSDEGLNITGALFQGGTSIFMGSNKHLGWGKTYNHLDLVDVFRLKMHPHKKLHYEIDGEWKKLEKRPVWLKVRILNKKGSNKGGIVLPVRKMTYWSAYGPTLQSPDKNFFSLRSPAFFTLGFPEQYYRMNTATNFDEFKKALDLNSLSLFNIVYADKDDNIFYLCNGKVPKRNPNYDFRKILWGNSSDKIWTEYHNWRELPQELNPDCGFVYNTNNTPTQADCEAGDDSKTGLLHYVDLRPGQNNRAVRFLELAEQKEKMSFEEFKDIKFDVHTSRNSPIFKSIREIAQRIDPQKYPHIADVLQRLYAWDGDGSPSNTTATLWILALDHLFVNLHLSDDVFIHGLPAFEDSLFVQGVEIGKDFLMRHYGRIDVPLEHLHCHLRNGKLCPAPGFPDALSPAYGKKYEAAGKFKMEYADTFIQFVRFGKDGAETIESLLPFEQTRLCEQYRDELQMFCRKELKIMSLDKETVLKQAVKLYSPGQ